MGQYEYPPDEVLGPAVEKEGAPWVADQLGIPTNTLRAHLRRRGLPTRQAPKKLEVSEALKAVADLAS